MKNGLKMPFGKYKNELIEKLIITQPGYIDWILRQKIEEKFSFILEHINMCITLYDSRPYVTKCLGKNYTSKAKCENKVSKFSLYKDSLIPAFWCKDCDPYQLGAYKQLTILSNYKQILNFIHFSCNNSNPDFRFLIKEISLAKGLTGRRTESKILEFFYEL